MTYNYTSDRLLKTPLKDPKPQAAIIPGLTEDDDGVAIPSLSNQRMQQWWDVISAVRGGTSKLRELGEAYLPKEPGESDEAYSRRLGRVVFSPWYTRLVRGLVGMVLRKPPAPDNEKLTALEQEQFDEHLLDVTLTGDNLPTFAKDVFESAIDHNYAGILVEYPTAEGVETRADELALGLRPYWMLFNAPDILGIKFQQIGSQRRITQVRLKQTVTEDDGEFGETEIEQVLVYDLVEQVDELTGDRSNRCRYRVFREVDVDKDKKRWQVVDQRLLSLTEVPFAICYTDKKCRLELQPPMLEVGYLNLKHYQLQADLDHALHIASVPRMFIFGASADDVGAIDSIDEAVCIPSPDARVEWSSAKLDSFAPLSSRIEQCEMQMTVLGLSTMVAQKNVGESAESKRLDRTQGDSIMAVIAQSLQNALNMALYFHAQYMGWQSAPTCKVNRDFDLSQMSPQMLTALHQIRQGGNISRETFFELMKQAEIGLSDDWTPELENERLQQEFAADAARRSPQTPLTIDQFANQEQL